MVLNRTMNSNQHGETTPLMQLLNGMVIHSAILMICKIFLKFSMPLFRPAAIHVCPVR